MPVPSNSLGVRHARLLSCADTSNDCNDACTPHDQKDRSNKLGALRPTPLVPTPCRAPRRPRAIDALKRIEFVNVTRNTQRMDLKVYYIDLYYRDDRQSRIPVHHHDGPQTIRSMDATARASSSTTPSATIEVAYNDVLQLRYDASELTRASHLYYTCAFCHEIKNLTMLSELMPRWNWHWSKTDDEVCTKLAAFVAELLRIAVEAPTGGGDQCHGQRRILELLQRFVGAHTDERRSE